MFEERFRFSTAPLARKENTVSGRCFRFTLITDRLIRLEYSDKGCFADDASQTVFFRDLGQVDFSVVRQERHLYVSTEKLTLCYEEGKPFSENTLSIRLREEPASTWHYGEDFEDLGGTARTLDRTDGSVPLGRGVCSRFGFSVIDDSDTMLLGEDGWVKVRRDLAATDVYFFGYGYDYVGAVRDFMRLTGTPPMLPAYALGNWWSRYHKYTQDEYIHLMERFKAEDIPFSVGVIDMDWHVVDIPEEQREEEEAFKSGWTGYTWNTALFPDYKAFLKHLKGLGLHTALNLHPAQGVRKHEAMYTEAARAAGIDPDSGKRVPLNVLSPKAMADYFDILHHPYEKQGVDFWWMDWQQGTDYWWIHKPNTLGVFEDPRERLDPLWMLNHLHIADIGRNGKRPMFFSRYSGPGSQRYPVGFSGDTRITWDALRLQPYFTATASNIGYCWWSHDIGGHMHGYRDEQLAVRWLQLGVFSPINRLHSTSNAFQLKEPWTYGKEAEAVMGRWLRLRHRLFPYIYAMNRRCHKELLPLVQPMYYSHPKCSASYEVKNQFWFGSELIVAPITEPNGQKDLLGRAEAWLPRGDWFDFETGLRYHSERGRRIELFRDLDHYPVLAKAGAIVPLYSYAPRDNSLACSEDVEIRVFPLADGAFELYEDEGEGQGYAEGDHVITSLTLEWGAAPRFTVHPAKGPLDIIPKKRNWTISLCGFNKNADPLVTVNGVPCRVTPKWQDECNALCVKISAPVTAKVEISLIGNELVHDNGDVERRLFDMLAKAQLTFEEKNSLYSRATAKGLSLHEVIYRLGNPSRDGYHTVCAIKELLTLTKDEFEE